MIPVTFSATTQVGLTSDITRNICGQRKRSSSLPLRFPATENGWQGQGKPPVRIVGSIVVGTSLDITSSLYFFIVKSCMSSIIGTCGQCLFITFWQNLSFSQNTVVLKPAHSAARANPPMPEKRSICVKFIFQFYEPVRAFKCFYNLTVAFGSFFFFVSITNRPIVAIDAYDVISLF